MMNPNSSSTYPSSYGDTYGDPAGRVPNLPTQAEPAAGQHTRLDEHQKSHWKRYQAFIKGQSNKVAGDSQQLGNIRKGSAVLPAEYQFLLKEGAHETNSGGFGGSSGPGGGELVPSSGIPLAGMIGPGPSLLGAPGMGNNMMEGMVGMMPGTVPSGQPEPRMQGRASIGGGRPSLGGSIPQAASVAAEAELAAYAPLTILSPFIPSPASRDARGNKISDENDPSVRQYLWGQLVGGGVVYKRGDDGSCLGMTGVCDAGMAVKRG